MQIIDRRQNPGGRNLGNRQRFINRARSRLRRAIKDNILERSISDTESGETVTIPADDTHEPEFRRDDSTGTRSRVFTGNREFQEGDTIPRPKSGGGGGGGAEGSDEGEGEDSFVFTLSRDEFLDLVFEDLQLPALVKKQLKAETSAKPKRAGFSMSGPAARLNLMRSMRGSLMRRAALGRPKQVAIDEMERELSRLEAGEIVPPDGRAPETRIAELREMLERARTKRARVPYLDPLDLRYNRVEHRPEPIAQAVMFCLMDVSASMNEEMKGLAKRFFMLLHLFLQRQYDHVAVVFIRHTQRAEEVDEETFFTGRQTGGTVVSSALEEMIRIAKERFPVDDWNIYVAQASDGDNFTTDVAPCARLLEEKVLPITQYMAYVEIDGRLRGSVGFSLQGESDLWRGYEGVAAASPKLQMRRIGSAEDIYPVFRDLFKAEEAPS